MADPPEQPEPSDQPEPPDRSGQPEQRGKDIDPGIPIEQMFLIVVGSHLRAERMDRPLAYDLADAAAAWFEQRKDQLPAPLEPVVCSDIWYVNDTSLQKRPTISIGGPGVNALTAYYSQHLPPATVEPGDGVIQCDQEWVDLRVSIWGMDHASTVKATQRFIRHHLESYLRAVVTQVEPLSE